MAPRRRRPLAVAVTTIGIGCGALHAGAQEMALEEVVVTAQKKAESLQDTPISISAFTSDHLEQIGAFSAVDVGDYTPNALITRSLGSNYNIRVSIRGLGTAEPSLSVDPKVGVYLDGVYIARNAGAVFDIVDLERVEIMRGPQGTLWGRNTTGGAISLITQKPTGELGGKVNLTAGNFGNRRALLSVDTPDVGGFAARLSYLKQTADGWADNTNREAPGVEKDLGSEDTDALRVALQWDVTDTFTASYAFDYTDGEGTAAPTQVGFVDASTDPDVSTIDLGDGFKRYSGNAFTGMAAIADDKSRRDKFDLDNMRAEDIEISGHNLTLSWLLGDLEIRSITSYRDYDSDQQGLDLDDGSWLKFRDGVASTATVFHTEGSKEQDQFSQEFQFLGSAFSDKMDYVVGVYYFDEEGKEINPWQFTFYNPANDVNVLFNGTRGAWYEITGETQAIYGQANYHFNEKWRLSLGARYTWDEKELTLLEEDPGLDRDYKSSEDWSEPTGMVNLTYFFDDDINVYGKISQGYAAGIYNPGTIFRNGYSPADPTPALTPADPEETTAYEIGLKSRFWDGRLQFNAAAFYNDNDNLQSTDFVDGIRQTINSGESETTGFEVDMVALLAEHWTVFANYGYSDTDYSEPGKYSTPFKTGSAAVQWELPVNYGLWTARLDATYMGETRFSISDPRVRSESRTLWNARVGLAEVPGLGGQFRFALWGRNLADEEYIEHGANYGSFTGYTWGQPRTYGVDLTYEF